MTSERRPWPIRVRRAQPADRDAVLSFASRTWDGWDYIPDVWPRWIEAPDGVLLVALPGRSLDGAAPRDARGAELPLERPIAVTRVALLDAGEAWLEGIRVDPRVRGLSVATDLQVAELRWAAAQGATVVRYLTGEQNEGSLRLGARHGFEVLGSWRTYGRDDADEPSGGVDVGELRARLRGAGLVLPPDTLEAEMGHWWQRLAADPTFRLGSGLYEHRPWTLQPLNRARLVRHARAGEVLVSPALQDRQGPSPAPDAPWALAIVSTLEGAEAAGFTLATLAGDPVAAFSLLEATIRAGEIPTVRYPQPTPPILRDGGEERLRTLGLAPRSHVTFVLERPLNSANPVPEPDDPRLLELPDPPRAVAVPPIAP